MIKFNKDDEAIHDCGGKVMLIVGEDTYYCDKCRDDIAKSEINSAVRRRKGDTYGDDTANRR